MGLWPSLLRRLTLPPIPNSRNILLPKLICMLKCVLNVTLCVVKPSNYFFHKKFLWNIYKVLLYQVTLKQFSQNFFWIYISILLLLLFMFVYSAIPMIKFAIKDHKNVGIFFFCFFFFLFFIFI